MTKVTESIKNVLINCFKAKKNESVLIIYDSKKARVVKSFLSASREVCKNVELIRIPIGKVSGEEPQKKVAELMKSKAIILAVTTKSITHTQASKNACNSGARIATMAGITEAIIKRTFETDPKEMSKLTEKVKLILDRAETMTITTKKGTDLSLVTKGRKSDGNSDFSKPGTLGNLPGDEAYIAPLEGKSNGTVVIDASMAGIGKLKDPITLKIKDGFVTKISGGKDAKKLKAILKSVRNKNAYNLAELGIGTNKKANVSGVNLEDEKVYGTAHIALGNNSGFGGKINVKLHLDGVFYRPTIIADGKKIFENGKFLF